MRFAVSRRLVALFAAAVLGGSASFGQEPLEAPPVSLDAFAGRTVKDRNVGYGIIKARAKNLPQVGTPAPDFDLKLADGKRTVKLSSFRGKRPVVLIFGSVT